MSRSGDPRPDQVLQSYLDDLLITSDEPSAASYADPLEEQRERLQKLLYSAAPLARSSSQEPLVAPDPVQVADSIPVAESVQSVEAVQVVEPVQVETAPGNNYWVKPVKSRVPVAQPEPVHVTVSESQREFERAQQQAQLELAEEARLAAVAEQNVQDAAGQSEQHPDLDPGEHPFEMQGVEWLDNGRPVWAQKRFDVLLFKVSGLTLAVPLISLGQIQPMNDDLTPLFGQADWFMGLLPTPAGKIRTVNTAKFVMPERYDENFLRTAQYVISIDGVPWGLAVDSVNQPISLDPDDVKWRSERSRRPWLAGTVKEHMCALLDIPRVGQLLMQADTRRRA